MKKLIPVLLGALAFSSCTDDSGVFVPDGVKEPTLPTETKPNDVVDGNVFSKLNLDYPGLEKVKAHYEASEHYLAAKELLEYFRFRSNVINPVAGTYTKPTPSDLNMANQALDYRFVVATFKESDNGTPADKSDDTYYSFKNADGTINWGLEPEGTSREFLYQQHRHQWMEPQAKSYSDTRNEAYFNNWVEVYSNWMAKYPCPNAPFDDPTIKDREPGYEWKGLQPAQRVLSMVNVIQYYISSPNFTPEWLCTVMKSFAENVEMVRMNYIDDGNIRITQGQAVASAGILYPEFANAEEWVREGIQTMDQDGQFRADGVHVDLDFSYHISAITDYMELYKLVKVNNRIDVLPANYLEKLKGAMHFVSDMIYPDYTIDNFNDTRSISYVKSTLMNRLKEYIEVFPDDEELLWMAWEGAKGGTRPQWKSKAYWDAGYYMMRSKDWSAAKGIMMIHKNNENSARKWHCQPDNGTFSLWYNGRNFFPDAGVFSYDDPSTARSTYRKYTLHNTMSCQGKDIKETQQLGRLLKQESTDKYELIVTENTPYKAGQTIDGFAPTEDVKHRRAIFFVDNKFFVLVDEGYSEGKTLNTKINLNFHLYSEEGKQATVVNNPKAQGAVKGYALAKTNLDGANLIIKSFSDINGNDFEMKTEKGDVAVSNEQGKTIGSVRDFLRVNDRINPNLAARIITVLYPSDGVAGDGTNIDACFTDNAEDPKGTFHAEGASVQVTVDGKTYDLNYTLN